MSQSNSTGGRAWLDWLPLAGLIALGGALCLSTESIAAREWIGIGIWAILLLVAVLVSQVAAEARGLLAIALVVFALAKSLNLEQLEQWWIWDVNDPGSATDWSRLTQQVPIASWIVLYLLVVGLIRWLANFRSLGMTLAGTALGGLLLLLVGTLTPAALTWIPSTHIAGAFPYAVGAGWQLAHYGLPLLALAGACQDPTRSRWMGGVMLLAWAAKAVLVFAGGGS